MALTTLAKVKQYLQIDPTDSAADGLLSRMIDAASATIEVYCSRKFEVQTSTEVHDGNGNRKMTLNHFPIISVASVSVNGQSIPARPSVTGNGFTYDDISLRLTGYRFDTGLDNVEVTYTAGLAEVPDDVDLACCETVALRYKTLDRLGVSSKTLAGESISFNTGDFSDPVKRVLDQYKVWGKL